MSKCVLHATCISTGRGHDYGQLLATYGAAIRGTVHLPPLFWWEGLDGSRVLTMYWTIYGNVYGNVVLGNRWVD